MASARPKHSFVEEWRSLWEPDLEAIAFNGATCDPTRVDPKVLQWVKKHCYQNPHFIKVIIPGAVATRPRRAATNCRMAVPAPFVQQHFRKLERVVKLENEAGKVWKVSFEAPRRHPMWQQGWGRFASDNNLKSGDVIVFVLVGNSHFRFNHFDEDGNKLIFSHNTSRTPNDETTPVKKEFSSCSSQSHEGSDSEDAHLKSRDTKRAPPLLSKKDKSRAEFRDERVIPELGFDHHHVVSQLCAPTDSKQMSDSSFRKRRRLCKVGEKLKECCEKEILVTVNNDAHRDFEEGGSTENPSSATIVNVTPRGKEKFNIWGS